MSGIYGWAVYRKRNGDRFVIADMVARSADREPMLAAFRLLAQDQAFCRREHWEYWIGRMWF